MSVAGYSTLVKLAGATTAMTDQATTNTSGDFWQITDVTRRVLDRDVLPTFEDNAVPISAADIASIDYLFGIVEFTASKTGPITFATGSFVPLTAVAGANAFTLNQSVDALDDTEFAGDGSRSRIYGLKDVALSLTRILAIEATFVDAINDRTPVMVDVQPGGSGPIARGWYVAESQAASGDIGSLEQTELSFQLDGDTEAVFAWGAP